MERAAKSNLDLRVAEARIREARAERGVVTGSAWPEVDVGGTYERRYRSRNNPFQGGSGGTFTGASNRNQSLYEAGFDMSWEIDLFGRLKRGVEAADADVAAAVENRRDVLVSLIAEIGRRYVDLRALQRRLALAQETIRTQEDTLALTRSRYAAGLTSDLDVAQAEGLLARTQAQAPAIDTALKAAMHRLDVLAGQAPGTLDEELSAEDGIPAAAPGVGLVEPPEVPVGLPSDLLLRRPDLRRAERELAAATARIGLATSDLFPRISLTGGLGFQSGHLSDLFMAASHYWIVSPTVSWPIFEAGRIRANIRVQDARQEQALAKYRQAVLVSFEEVENALVAYGREQARRRSLQDAVSAAERAAALAEERYARGVSDFLNVLDARRTRYDAQDQLVQSGQAVSTDLVALYKALGGGWEEASTKSQVKSAKNE